MGVELAQWVTVALIFPSLYLVSRTRFYGPLRMVGASVALAAALGWALDRLGVLDNPLAGVEEAVITHPWYVVAGLAVLAVCCRLLRPTTPHDARARRRSGQPDIVTGAVRAPQVSRTRSRSVPNGTAT